jgi:hypothetical protein
MGIADLVTELASTRTRAHIADLSMPFHLFLLGLEKLTIQPSTITPFSINENTSQAPSVRRHGTSFAGMQHPSGHKVALQK